MNRTIENQLLKRFRALDFPKEAIGLGQSGENTTYFCTPVGAEIIGWLGVDGIHFCLIPAFSPDMVFAISPMPCGPRYVEPVARSFEDFLSLVLFCKDASPLEQICYLEEARFLALLQEEEQSICPEKAAALQALRTGLGLEAQPEAYRYVRQLQAELDYAAIPFLQEYYDTVGEDDRPGC